MNQYIVNLNVPNQSYAAVIDPNVIVSGLLNFLSSSGIVLLECLDGKITPLLNDYILEEYEKVLKRDKFKFPHNLVDTLIKGIKDRAEFIDPKNSHIVIKDPKDVIFWDLIDNTKIFYDARLVTGNLKHFPVTEYVVTSPEMLKIIKAENPEYQALLITNVVNNNPYIVPFIEEQIKNRKQTLGLEDKEIS